MEEVMVLTVGEVNRLSREVDRINRIIDTLDPLDPRVDLYHARLEKISGRLEESLEAGQNIKNAGIRAINHIKMKELGLEVIPGENRFSHRGIAKLSLVRKRRKSCLENQK